MSIQDFQYIVPKSVQDAVSFLADHPHDSKIIAGGTDVLLSLKQDLYHPKYLVAIYNMHELAKCKLNSGGFLSLGPMVKLHAIESDPSIAKNFPILRDAAKAVGSPQLREMGTVGGNLLLNTRCYYYNQSRFWRSCRPRCLKVGGETCNAVGGGKKCFAVFSGDLAPALITLEATVTLASAKGERTLLLRDLYTGAGERPFAMEPDELLVGIEVPLQQKPSVSSYAKYRRRKSIDFALAGVAATVAVDEKGKMGRSTRVTLGGVSSKPEEVRGLAELLDALEPSPRLAEEVGKLGARQIKPVNNVVGASQAQRKRMIQVFIARAFEAAFSEHE